MNNQNNNNIEGMPNEAVPTQNEPGQRYRTRYQVRQEGQEVMANNGRNDDVANPVDNSMVDSVPGVLNEENGEVSPIAEPVSNNPDAIQDTPTETANNEDAINNEEQQNVGEFNEQEMAEIERLEAYAQELMQAASSDNEDEDEDDKYLTTEKWTAERDQ
jgi:hypothetical protein